MQKHIILVAVLVVWVAAKVPDGQRPDPEFDLKKFGPVLHVEGKTIAEAVHGDDGRILHCRLHELEEEHDAEDILKNNSLPVKYPTFKGMMHLIKECNKFPLENNGTLVDGEEDYVPETINTTHSTWSLWALWRGILPGTKWCGMGDIATSFEDLGPQYRVDSCCRAHDFCPVKLKSFRSGYDLINFSLYTKSHCDCDHGLYNCLKDTKSRYADVVGNIYFNLLRVQCLKNRKSFVCVQNRTESNGSIDCARWELDQSNKKMQMVVPVTKY